MDRRPPFHTVDGQELDSFQWTSNCSCPRRMAEQEAGEVLTVKADRRRRPAPSVEVSTVRGTPGPIVNGVIVRQKVFMMKEERKNRAAKKTRNANEKKKRKRNDTLGVEKTYSVRSTGWWNNGRRFASDSRQGPSRASAPISEPPERNNRPKSCQLKEGHAGNKS